QAEGRPARGPGASNGAQLARREVFPADRPEVDFDGALAGPVVRRHDAAGPRRSSLQFPPQRRRHPPRDERRSDAVATPIARVVDPELRDPGEKRPAVKGREELRKALPPRPEARPLKVGQPESLVRDRDELRESPKRVIRLLEA